MQVQVNSNNSIQLSERLQRWVSDEVTQTFDRYTSKLTRVEVYFNDLNAEKGGVDKECTVETRPSGLPLLAAKHKAETIELALRGALDKLSTQVEKHLDKLDHKKGRTPFGGEPFAELNPTPEEVTED